MSKSEQFKSKGMSIVAETEQFVADLLNEKLSDDFRYHNLQHTLSVRAACVSLAEKMDVSSEDQEVLELAALFHDTGFSEVYVGHEDKSKKIALTFLQKHDYPEEKLQKVLSCIDVTNPNARPENQLEKIIKDADLCNLAKPEYIDATQDLRHEWALFLNQTFSDRQWDKLNLNFLKDHQYYTLAAHELFDPQKTENIKNLKKLVKKKKAKLKLVDKNSAKVAKLKPPPNTLNSNKSAQMMFKTALRNHLDLSNLADNKANIMLSVNALIITFGIPLAAPYLDDYPYLLAPLLCLIITCIGSMIYATLATRPIKMTGYTPEEQIKSAGSNLFFFGNFFKMSFKEYQQGMQHIMDDEAKLEDSIMRDLYFLGKSLGHKYQRLRTCYTVFMAGIIVTVLIFGFSYLWSQ